MREVAVVAIMADRSLTPVESVEEEKVRLDTIQSRLQQAHPTPEAAEVDRVTGIILLENLADQEL
jgi:hypothetical protein